MNTKTRQTIFRNIVLIALSAALLVFWYRQSHQPPKTEIHATTQPGSNTVEDIATLTNHHKVIAYVKAHNALPHYYITKNEARKMGWVPATGNLCDVLPGKAIGGDAFGNREKKLPMKKDRKWYEADVNYHCGTRNQDRIVYSNDGLIFLSTDHYQTFTPQ